MKTIKFAIFFLFVAMQQCMATRVTYKYSDENIAKNEYCASLTMSFSDIGTGLKTSDGYFMRVRFWNNFSCTNQIKGVVLEETSSTEFTTSYKFNLSLLPFEANMRSVFGNNYIGPVDVYMSIDIYKRVTQKSGINVIEYKGCNYRLVETCKPKQRADGTRSMCFAFRYILPTVEEHTGGLDVSFPSYRNTNERPVTPLKDFKVVASFWKDPKRMNPLIFYTSNKRNDVDGNPQVFYEMPDPEDLLPGETFFETNEIERVQHDWNKFVIGRLPDGFLYKVGLPSLKPGEVYDGKYYVYADVYSMDGKLLNSGKYPMVYTRHVVGAACHHKYKSFKNVTDDKRQINQCWYKLWKRYEYSTVCQKCGHAYTRHYSFYKGMFRDENAPRNCPPIRNDKENNKENNNDDDNNNEGDQGSNSNEDNLFVSYEEERNETKLPPKNGIERVKVDKTIVKIDLMNDTREKVGTYTEAEWNTTPPCQPHNMKTVDGYLSKCSACGITDYTDAPEQYEYLTASQCKTAITLNVNDVPLKMVLVCGSSPDDSPVYVAATETTQGLWAAVYPENWKMWQKESVFPASGLPYIDVCMFVDMMNYIAKEKKWPLHFMLPTVGDWFYAYTNGGSTGNGWNADNSYHVLHPVCGFKPSSKGIYDMDGGVMELTSEYRDGEKKEYADPFDVRAMLQNDVEVAACGTCFRDASDVSPLEERWGGLGPADDTGFRLFAIPVKR